MVQHAQEHHDIEVADLGGREAANVVDAVFGLRSQQIARDAEALDGGGIDRQHARAAALQFESEPAVPRADVERALAAQIGGNGKLGEAVAQDIQALEAGNHTAIGQFHAVVPAEAGEFFETFFWFGSAGLDGESAVEAPLGGGDAED
jgi:hypothetical protein